MIEKWVAFSKEGKSVDKFLIDLDKTFDNFPRGNVIANINSREFPATNMQLFARQTKNKINSKYEAIQKVRKVTNMT